MGSSRCLRSQSFASKNVDALSNRFEVSWIAANSQAALVIKLEVLRHFTDERLIGHLMHAPIYARFYLETPVAFFFISDTCRPQPAAAVGFGNALRPEALW